MATIYADRAVISASNGTFLFQDGDVQSIAFNISGGAIPVQGQNLDHTTSGFISPNRTVTVTFSVFLRKGAAFSDYLKNIDYTQPVSIQGMVADTGSGQELGLTTRITAINCIAESNNYNFSGVSNPASSSVTFLAEDYLTE